MRTNANRIVGTVLLTATQMVACGAPPVDRMQDNGEKTAQSQAALVLSPLVKKYVDFDGNGQSDIGLTNPVWASVPYQEFLPGDTSGLCNIRMDAFTNVAQQPGAHKLFGDFSGDGKTDIVALGQSNYGFFPVAISNGDGSFHVDDIDTGAFTDWAATSGVEPLVGDFDGNGTSDIALVGYGGWTSIPLAFFQGGGDSVLFSNGLLFDFPGWSATAGVERLVGDFNGDGKADIALTGAAWASVPVALSLGTGSFTLVNSVLGGFPAWSSTPGVQRFAADFNGDGYTDIALTGPAWASVPVALSNGDGTFTVVNAILPGFPTWSAASGTERWLGDFNGDGRADIALTNPAWASIPIAMGNTDGTFSVANVVEPSIVDNLWMGSPRRALCDYNGDGKTDIWLDVIDAYYPAGTYGILSSVGDGSFALKIPQRSTFIGNTSGFDGWVTLSGTTLVSNYGRY